MQQEVSYTTIDKTGWGNGPWQAEPDKISFADETTGLPCLIVRGPSGALCGYVGVHSHHPSHAQGYWPDRFDTDGNEVALSPVDQAIHDISAHGGLTFADGCQHSDDPSRGICHVPAPGEPDDVWWFGFDCAHASDYLPAHEADYRQRISPERWTEHEAVLGLGRANGWGGVIEYRDVAYVKGEIASLARQLAEMLPVP